MVQDTKSKSEMGSQEFHKALSHAKDILKASYPMLMIHENQCHNEEPFLHLWKSVSKRSPTQGMTFLPCFHVIVTCPLVEENLEVICFSLMTFHGKKLAEATVDMDTKASERLKNLDLLNDLAYDNLHICQGVQDLKERRWKTYLSKAKVPILDKVKNIFFFEPLEEDVIMRSRLCTYFVRDPIRNDDIKATDYVRCKECWKYHRHRNVSLFTYRNKVLPDLNVKLEEDDEMSDDMVDNEYLVGAENIFFEETAEREELEDFDTFSKNMKNSKVTENVNPQLPIECQVKIEPLAKEEMTDAEIGEQLHEATTDKSDNCGSKRKRRKRSKVKKPGTYSEESLSLAGGWVEADPMFESHLDFKEDKCVKEDADEDFVNENFEEDKEEEHVIKKKEPKWPKKVTKVDYALILRKSTDGLKMEVPNAKGLFLLQKDHEYIYQCGVCTLNRVKYEHVVRCAKRHAEALNCKEPINCPVCDERIENKGCINEHFYEKHSEMKKFCCCECLELFDDEMQLLRKHIIKMHHTAFTKNHLCTHCGNGFHHVHALQQHIVRMHGEAKNHICPHCGKMYATITELGRHVTIQHSSRDVKCLRCDKQFPNFNRVLVRHLETHTG